MSKAIWCGILGTPRSKQGAPRDECSKLVLVVVVFRRNPKGDGGKGTGKKCHDNLLKPCGLECSGGGPHLLQPGAVSAPKCVPLREVSVNSPSQRKAYRQLPSPRGRHCLPSEEARVPLREVVRGQPSCQHFEVVLSHVCPGYHQNGV